MMNGLQGAPNIKYKSMESIQHNTHIKSALTSNLNEDTI